MRSFAWIRIRSTVGPFVFAVVYSFASRRDLIPELTLGAMSRYGSIKGWFDIFTRGTQTIHWKASAHPWNPSF